MKEEFQTKVVKNITRLTSSRGFTVEVTFGGGAVYIDATGRVPVDLEWLGKPPGVLIYTESLCTLTRDRSEEVLSNLIRALQSHGSRVETC